MIETIAQTAQRQWVLASSSAPRKKVLSRLGIPFTVDAPNIDETALPNEAVPDLVIRLAVAKARVVAEHHDNAWIIGCDQVAMHAGKAIGKPHTHARAVETLTRFSGNTVTFMSGLCLFDSHNQTYQTERTDTIVTFRPLSAAQIEAYLKLDHPYQCAGAIKAEQLGIALTTRIESPDPSAMIGLSLTALTTLFGQVGVDVIRTATYYQNQP